MKRIPDISIIIPIADSSSDIRHCLDSILAQTLFNFEVVCINSGSANELLDIVNEYIALDDRICVVDASESGYSSAVNAFIETCPSKYIGFVDPHDYMLPVMYEKLLFAIEKHNMDFVRCEYFGYHEKSGKRFVQRFRLSEKTEHCNRVIDPVNTPDVLKYFNRAFMRSGLYRVEFLNRENIRFYDDAKASCQDIFFSFVTTMTARSFMYITEPFYICQLDVLGASYSMPEILYKEYDHVTAYLEKKNELKTLFAPYCMQWRYHSYLEALPQMPKGEAKPFLSHFSKLFDSARKSGALDQALFEDKEWETILSVIKNPSAYLNKYIENSTGETEPEPSAPPKVSVVMAIYNAEKFIDQCLKSILNQTLNDIEIICVDDGSVDNTLKRLVTYAEEDNRVTVLTQKNASAGAARNAGLELARGEYLSFLDSDDFFELNMLESAYARVKEMDADIVVFKCDLFDNVTRKTSPCSWAFHHSLLPEKPVFNRNDMGLNTFFVFNGWAWDKLFRRSFVEKHGIRFQSQRTTNDMFFVYYSICLAQSITTLPMVFAHRRLNLKDSLSNTRWKSWDCFYKALLHLREELINSAIYPELEQSFVNYCLDNIMWNVSTLRGESFIQLYTLLQEEIFETLCITTLPDGYFFKRKEYEQYQKIMSMSPAAYTLELLDMQSNELKAAKNALAAVEQSSSYKIGRALTHLPRKLRDFKNRHSKRRSK